MALYKSSDKFINRKFIEDVLKGVKICRIATVSYYLVFQLKGQVEYVREIGMNVVLVASDGPEWSEIELGRGLSKEIVEISRSLRPWKDLVAFFQLIKLFRKNKFRIVHSTTPKAGLLTAIAALLVKVPVRLHTWTGQQWVNLKGPMRWISILADKIIGIVSTKCYADSISQRQFLVDERIIAPQKIAVIGHGSLAGVDLNRFDPGKWSFSRKQEIKRECSILPASKVLIFVGRITREKGIFELISAFLQLLNQGYVVDLLLIGPLDQDRGGTDSLRLTDIKQYPQTHYIGYTECPERYLAISDIFCLPSYREGFGTTVIEAAAMGIPTVGSYINGLTDAVAHGETGILVPPRNVKALTEALRQLLDDPDLLSKMGKAARQRCVQQFDANIVNNKIAEEYVNVLKNIRGYD